ncbi:MAG: ATP-binding protein [bacterium]
MIIRNRYLDRLQPFINRPLIKAITGVRRCGKSTLLQQIVQSFNGNIVEAENIILINKELLEFDAIKTYVDLHQYIHLKSKGRKGTIYVFIDEVQEIEQWERAIASLFAEKRFDIYITGSNARLLSSELSTLLSGRYIEIKMYPFIFKEFFEISSTSGRISNPALAFEKFIKYGGFPGLHSLEWDDIPVRQFLESIYNTILLKDIVIRYGIRDVYMLEKIVEYLISNCGNITSANKISAFVKSQHKTISVDTVQNYINYTRSALLTHQIKRYNLKGKRILESLEKYYTCDTGLNFAVKGYSPDALPGNLENIVLLELLSRGYIVYLGKWNTHEIDFIAEKGTEKIYLQVCTTLKEEKTVDREYRALESVNDHFPKLVLSLDEGFDTSRKGIRWMNIKDFLLQG